MLAHCVLTPLIDAQLDRLLGDYRIAHDACVNPMTSFPPHPRDNNPKFRKVQVLLEFLGAYRILDRREKMMKEERERERAAWRGVPGGFLGPP